jgi:DNA-binding NarL/FixJ family response regulator
MAAKTKLRLLLVDDHIVVRMGLAFMINSQPDMSVAGEAGTGAEAVDLLTKAAPDVVLMDLRLPDMTGIECTAKLRKVNPDARIIILTTYGGDENIYRALQEGARGYLLKDMGRDEILCTVRAVAAGQSCLPPTVAAALAQRLPEADLSAREIEILRFIARGRSNKEIGGHLGISESTVKGHINHLLSKLRANDRTEAVTLGLRRGLITLD